MKRLSLPLGPRAARGAACAASALALAWLAACTDRGTPTQMPAPEAPASAPASGAANGVAIARGRIEVQGGILDLTPLQEGVVDTVAVHEGQAVKRGQVLLRLSGTGLQAEADVAQAELQLAEARERARAQQVPALRRTAARPAEAAAANAAEPQRADDAAQALRAAESDAAVARAEAEVARKKLAQVRGQQARLELRAPEDGTVVHVRTQAGVRLAAAAASHAVITLLPHRPLIVRAEVNQNYAAAVKPGMRASVTTDGDTAPVALPAARVVRISPVLGASRLQEDAQRGPMRVVECVLEFDSPPEARPGQTVRVSFLPLKQE
ncbi:HlyD family secretion protein [Paracidovorax avenae]|uniref:HlyD family secretion protein n=3 Tax=Paracidovorax avenae TaxID=80867 RepID=UPI000D21B20C|nr:HlyD family efflux transporter periplasmic adaptor subunit [Paracidovorax avenae]AVT10898.1 secretion protein HlyD [Paracidovorax avenae]